MPIANYCSNGRSPLARRQYLSVAPRPSENNQRVVRQSTSVGTSASCELFFWPAREILKLVVAVASRFTCSSARGGSARWRIPTDLPSMDATSLDSLFV